MKINRFCFFVLTAVLFCWGPSLHAQTDDSVLSEIGRVTNVSSVSKIEYSPDYDLLFLMSGSEVRVLQGATGELIETHTATNTFTDFDLTRDGRYLFVADYGGERTGYGTPLTTHYVHRYDLEKGTWTTAAAPSIAWKIEAVSSDRVLLQEHDQWIDITLNSFDITMTELSRVRADYYGDMEYDPDNGRVYHGNSGSSSHEIDVLTIEGDTLVSIENTGVYGTAQSGGGTCVLSTDGAFLYYGDLQVDAMNISSNLYAFSEYIYAASPEIAFGKKNYYSAETGALLGSWNFTCGAVATSEEGQHIWAYDADSETAIHYVDASLLTISVPVDGMEGDGIRSQAGSLSVVTAPSSNLVVHLVSSDPDEVVVPESIILPAGETNVLFDLEILDDVLLDGSQSVTISALPAWGSYPNAEGVIIVHDSESNVLSLSLPQTTYEGVGSVSGAVQLDLAPDVDVTVELLSDNENEISSGSVVIAAGETFASFSLPVVDDSMLDGIQTATITAYVKNWQSGSASVFVMDNETTTMELQLPSSLTEGDGTITNGGTVSLSGTTTTDINVMLTSSDAGELEVPDFVTIPAGTNQVAFDVTVGDDTETDGTVGISVLAQIPGYIPASMNVSIVDNDLHHFLVEGVTNVALFGSADITISAVSIDDTLIDGFAEPISLSASGDRGDVVITPATVTNMVDGTVSVTVSFESIGTDVTLTATAGDIAGASALFNVEGAQLILTPASLTNTLVVAGESLVRTMVISNAGNVDLEYEIQDVGDDVEVPSENLVLNGDFESGNTNFTSGYVYTSEGSYEQGIYTVGDDPTSWFSSISEMMTDHTSGSGQMLMANANFSGSYVVWQQDIDVTAGASYDLSFWVAGLQGGVLPSFDVRMAGSSIGAVAPSEMSVWTEFTRRWTATESGTVTLIIKNTQSIGWLFPEGIYFALDDIELVEVGVEDEVSDSGLVAYYPFNGNASDESGNGYDGTVTGATLTADRFGNSASAYDFNGTSAHIEVPHTDALSLDGVFSVSLWMKTSEANANSGLITKVNDARDGYLLGVGNDESAFLTLINDFPDTKGRIDTTNSVIDGVWHHLVATYDGDMMSIYLDGSLSAELAYTNGLTPNVSSMYIGWDPYSSDRHFDGVMDEVRIYSSALSAAEVEELYTESDSAGSEEPAVESAAVYYPFNGDATDESGNGNDGIVEGATLMQDRVGNADQAYRFDVGNYIRTADGAGAADITNVITMAAWINPEQFATKSSDPGVVRTILRKRSQYGSYGYTFGLSTEGQMTVAFGNSSNSGMAKTASNMDPLSTNAWSHVAVTYDGAQICYYVNGVLVDTQAYSQPLLSTTEALCIGRLTDSDSRAYFYGGIDEVSLFDRVLTEEEVLTLYTGVSDDGEEEPEASWLSVDPLMGTAPAGSNMMVSVKFDASGLVAGEQLIGQMMLMCNDLTTPTVPIDVSMYVRPTAPIMDAEPEVTDGMANTVCWRAVEGPVSYAVEVATATNAAALQESGWMAATNYTFSALETNVTYYYRARAAVDSDIGQLSGPWSDWVWSTQSATAVDADGDGIPDWWETQYFGVTGVLNPDGDSDGDGQSDIDEYVAGMNPTNPASCFAVNEAYAPTNGQFVIYWDAVTGRVYSIEWASAITNTFESMATDLSYPQNSYTDTLHQAEDSGFYKVKVDFE